MSKLTKAFILPDRKFFIRKWGQKEENEKVWPYVIDTLCGDSKSTQFRKLGKLSFLCLISN